jgi:hypothetical protein
VLGHERLGERKREKRSEREGEGKTGDREGERQCVIEGGFELKPLSGNYGVFSGNLRGI